MSAYLCHDDTFDFLATAAQRFGRHCRFSVTARPDMPDVPALIAAGLLRSDRQAVSCSEGELIAQILRAENIRSLRVRYGSDADLHGADRPYIYRAVSWSAIDLMAVVKSCDCLEYQSCEAENYRGTFAYRLLEAIRRTAVASMRDYEAAPWGWTRSHDGVDSAA